VATCRRLALLASWSGRSADAIHAAIWRSGFEDDAERGAISADEYLKGFGERMGHPLAAAQWIDARKVAMEPDPTRKPLASCRSRPTRSSSSTTTSRWCSVQARPGWARTGSVAPPASAPRSRPTVSR